MGKLDFGWALRQMKDDGCCMARRCWDEKTWIELSEGGETNGVPVDPYLIQKTEEGHWQPGWVPTQADMLAEDWMIVG